MAVADAASSSPPTGPPKPDEIKLDFRIADDEDIGDIAEVLSHSFAAPDFAYLDADAHSTEQVTEAFRDSPSSVRWLILETQRPEEKVVCVACLSVGGPGPSSQDHKCATLTNLAVLEDYRRKGIGTRMLRKCEAVARGIGCAELEMSVPYHVETLASFFSRSQWQQLGGGLWDEPAVRKPTSYCTYKRDLMRPRTAAQPKAPASQTPSLSTNADIGAVSELASGMASLLDSLDAHIPEPPQARAESSVKKSGQVSGESSLEDLLGTLLGQLGTPEGRAKFQELAEAEEPNVLGEPFRTEEH